MLKCKYLANNIRFNNIKVFFVFCCRKLNFTVFATFTIDFLSKSHVGKASRNCEQYYRLNRIRAAGTSDK